MTRADLDALEEVVAREMERLRVPGVAVGLILAGEDYARGFGVTSIEHPLPVDAETLFQIGSTTKTVVGTAAMRLVEQGRLDLDAPLRTYLPDLRLADEDTTARVTLRHVFTHTGGWVGDYFDDAGPGDDALARIVARMEALEQQTPLGTLWSYNNSGFYLAGRVIEVLTGQPFQAAIRDLVLEPLGMTRSFFFASEVVTHRFAVGHHVTGEGPVAARPWELPRAEHPAGGIVSTGRDQLRYARLHLGDGRTPDGRRLLSPEAVALMQSPAVEASGGNWWGLTWGTRRRAHVRTVFHGGATNGQTSSFLIAPDQEFAVTVLTNADRGAVLHEIVTRWALARFLGVQEPEPAPLEMGEDELGAYAGRYRGAGSTSDLDLRVGEGTLVMDVRLKGGFPMRGVPPPPAPPPMRLGFFERDRVVVVDEPMKGARGEFLRDADGRIAWFRLSRIRARQ